MPGGGSVYVANPFDGTVSVISAATDTVTATIAAGGLPNGVAVNPGGTQVYVANSADNTVSVISTATGAITATIPVGNDPVAVAISPTAPWSTSPAAPA